MKRILTGLQPSGELTLGSLIGSISQMVKYQDEYESFMFVPDMHAITVKQDPKLLKERIINGRKVTPGSVSFVPSVGGLTIASVVVRELLER